MTTATIIETQQCLTVMRHHFGLSFDESSFLTRCGKCNGSHLDAIAKEDLADDPRVPPKVYLNIDTFWECGGCKHVCVRACVCVKWAALLAVVSPFCSCACSCSWSLLLIRRRRRRLLLRCLLCPSSSASSSVSPSTSSPSSSSPSSSSSSSSSSFPLR